MGSTSCPTDVLIVGGGFAGIVTALTIANEKRHVTILETSAAPPRFSGDLIHPLGRQLLDEIGVLPRLLMCGAVPIHGFAVFPQHAKNRVDVTPTKLPYRDSVSGVAMNSRALVESLRVEASARCDIEFRTGCKAVEILRHNGRVIGVRDVSGCEWLAQLTIIAQGRHAPLRSQLRFDEKPCTLSLSAALSLSGVSLPVSNYAHIFMNSAPGGGPLLVHPLGGNEVRVSIDLPQTASEGRLRERILSAQFHGLPPELAETLRATLERPDAVEQLAIRTTCAFRTLRCAAAGVALVGDAAGCTHPITGTGMTTALVDARILREELDHAKLPGCDTEVELDHALTRYQQRRYRFARPRELLAEGLYEIFCGAEKGAGAMRCGLFSYWNASARARTISVALLSGEDSSIRKLFCEFVRVSVAALRAVFARRGFLGRADDLSTMRAILRSGIETFARFARGARSLRSTKYAVALSR